MHMHPDVFRIDVLSENVCNVLFSIDFVDDNVPIGYSVLDPQLIYLDVPHLTESPSACYSLGSASISIDCNLPFNAEIPHHTPDSHSN